MAVADASTVCCAREAASEFAAFELLLCASADPANTQHAAAAAAAHLPETNIADLLVLCSCQDKSRGANAVPRNSSGHDECGNLAGRESGNLPGREERLSRAATRSTKAFSASRSSADFPSVLKA